jgi:hypothetical protein
MDELVRQLSEENPVVACDALPLSEIWSRIDGPSANRRGRGLSLRDRPIYRVLAIGRSGLAVGGAVLVAILVAALALSVPHRQGHLTPGARGPASPAALTAELGVLRRRQTPADRALAKTIAGPLAAPGLGRVVPGLTRLVAKLPNGRLGPVYVYVVVQPPNRKTPAPFGRGQAPQASAFSAAVQLTSPYRGGGWDVGETAAKLRQVNPGWPGWGYYAVLVPDGVARVRWRFVSRRAATPPVTLTAAVHENVAIAKVPENRQGMVLVSPANATWYSAAGRVIGTYSAGPYQRLGAALVQGSTLHLPHGRSTATFAITAPAKHAYDVTVAAPAASAIVLSMKISPGASWTVNTLNDSGCHTTGSHTRCLLHFAEGGNPGGRWTGVVQKTSVPAAEVHISIVFARQAGSFPG